jgi:hypothetical protein
MKILFIGFNSSRHYSGGRYHAWLMAQALVKCGHNVDYWTNTTPFFLSDFKSRKYQDDIGLDLSLDFKIYKKGGYDFVILIPGGDRSLYYKSILSSYVNKSKLVLLNFESPNWYNDLSPVKKNDNLWSGWNLVAKESVIILSSCNESTKFAKKYYVTNDDAQFLTCEPSINSFALSSKPLKKEDEIIVITRFDKQSLHKGGMEILNIFSKAISKYTVKFLIGSDLDPGVKKDINALAKKTGVKIKFLYCLSDEQKFLEIKKSKYMIFLSRFEGFGYPPIESISNNTRCIVYNLPVFRETCGKCLDYVSYYDYGSIVNILLSDYSELSDDCTQAMALKYSFESYSQRLSVIFEKEYKSCSLTPNVKFYFYTYFFSINNFIFYILKAIIPRTILGKILKLLR